MIRTGFSAGEMRRNIFIFVSWVMLLVFIAATVGWVVSYAAPGAMHHYWSNDSSGDGLSIVSTTAMTSSIAFGDGRIGIGSLLVNRANLKSLTKLEGEYLLPDRHAPGNGFWNRLGFIYRSSAGGYNWGLSFPIWVIDLLAVPLPLLWLRWRIKRHKRQLRRGEGLCLACGYDLRGSEDRCPECGKPFLSRNRPEAVWVS